MDSENRSDSRIVLQVRGFEAVDGSPIIDVKPYSKSYLQVENLSMPVWMEQIHREMESGRYHSICGKNRMGSIGQAADA